jgi:hypothetical protein
MGHDLIGRQVTDGPASRFSSDHKQFARTDGAPTHGNNGASYQWKYRVSARSGSTFRLSKLRAHAEDLVKTLHELHGWEFPSTGNPRLEPLV